jgi:hypothetical protein
MLVDSILNNSAFNDEKVRKKLVMNIPNAKVSTTAVEIIGKIEKDQEGNELLKKIESTKKKDLHISGY